MHFEADNCTVVRINFAGCAASERNNDRGAFHANFPGALVRARILPGREIAACYEKSCERLAISSVSFHARNSDYRHRV